MSSFAVFDESFYLANNPDVAFSVAAGAFGSGLDHFQRVGLQEGHFSITFLQRRVLFASTLMWLHLIPRELSALGCNTTKLVLRVMLPQLQRQLAPKCSPTAARTHAQFLERGNDRQTLSAVLKRPFQNLGFELLCRDLSKAGCHLGSRFIAWLCTTSAVWTSTASSELILIAACPGVPWCGEWHKTRNNFLVNCKSSQAWLNNT